MKQASGFQGFGVSGWGQNDIPGMRPAAAGNAKLPTRCATQSSGSSLHLQPLVSSSFTLFACPSSLPTKIFSGLGQSWRHVPSGGQRSLERGRFAGEPSDFLSAPGGRVTLWMQHAISCSPARTIR